LLFKETGFAESSILCIWFWLAYEACCRIDFIVPMIFLAMHAWHLGPWHAPDCSISRTLTKYSLHLAMLCQDWTSMLTVFPFTSLRCMIFDEFQIVRQYSLCVLWVLFTKLEYIERHLRKECSRWKYISMLSIIIAKELHWMWKRLTHYSLYTVIYNSQHPKSSHILSSLTLKIMKNKPNPRRKTLRISVETWEIKVSLKLWAPLLSFIMLWIVRKEIMNEYSWKGDNLIRPSLSIFFHLFIK